MFSKRIKLLLLMSVLTTGWVKPVGKNDQKDLLLHKLECASAINEKVFLHLNRNILISGENVYFKAYVVNAESHLPSLKSKILYLELIDAHRKRIITIRFNIENGFCNGQINLPDTLPTGTYYINAFTNWMRNYNPEFYYSTAIFVGNQAKEIPDNLVFAKQNEPISISFYPEGGTMVEGIENKIAFKIQGYANDLQDFPVGQIIDESGNTVMSFKAGPGGMGTFIFQPESNKKYYAKIDNQGINQLLKLPEILKNGVVLNVDDNNAETITVKITSNIDPLAGGKQFHLYALSKGKIISDIILYASQGQQKVTLSKKDFPEGITYFILFNSNFKQLCNRSIYIKKLTTCLMTAYADKKIYKQKEKVHIQIKLTDSGYRPLQASLSAAVSEQEPTPLTFNHDILSYLNLTSDLPGTAIQTSIDSLSDECTNMLALTQKWQNSEWNYILSSLNQNFSCPSEDNGYLLSGTAINKVTNKPIANTYVLLATPDSLANLNYFYTDSAGRFYFLLDKYYDNKSLIITVNDHQKAKESKIVIDDKFAADSAFVVNNIKINAILKNFLSSSKKISLINKIYSSPSSTETPVNFTLEKNVYNFYGKPDYIEYPANYIELPNFDEICTNILYRIKFRKKKDNYSVYFVDPLTNEIGPQECLVLLNNIPFHDLSYISTFDSKKIKRIEVSLKHIAYGNIDFYGILSIFTKEGEILTNGTSISVSNKVEASSSFSSVPSEKKESDSNKLPDFRQTLYWNPEVKVGENGTAIIEFYTSDLKTKYKVDIQGITNDGKPVSITTFFDVQ